MSSTALPAEPFYYDVAAEMIERRVDFLGACSLLGIPMTVEEGLAHQRRKSWKEVHDRVAKSFYEAKAAPASHTKTLLIGKMIDASERLDASGKQKERAEVLFQIAKAENWVGGEITNNIFANLDGTDFERLRDRVKKRKEQVQDASNSVRVQ